MENASYVFLFLFFAPNKQNIRDLNRLRKCYFSHPNETNERAFGGVG